MEFDRILLALRLVAEVETHLPKPDNLNPAKLFKDAEQCVQYDHCIVCRLAETSQADSRLEQHHVAGKVLGSHNFPDTITVCDGCHEYLSDFQKAWLIMQADSATCLSSYFFGWMDIFNLLCQQTQSLYYCRLASKFRSQGWYIRNGIKNRRLAQDVITA